MKRFISDNKGLFWILFIFAVFFFIDIVTPLGYTGWGFYFLLFLLNFPLKQSQIFPLAALASVLIVLGKIFSPGELFIVSAVNRAVGFIILWLGAIFLKHRKNAERIIYENQRDFKRAQEVGHVGSWRLDLNKNELAWSEETYRIFNVPFGTKVTYELFLSFVHPDDREFVDQQWKAALAGESYDIDHRIIVNEKVKWVREKAYLEFDSGELLGGFGIVQDITDRKLAEEALQRSEQFNRKVAESSINGIYIFDLETGGFDYINPGYEKITGYNLQDLKHRKENLLDLFHPSDRPRIVEHLSKMRNLKEGEVREIEYCFRTAWGQWIWCLSRETLFESDPKGNRYIGTFIDISDRKRAEGILRRDKETFERMVDERSHELLEAQKKLERTDRLSDIGQFSSAVVHELRNPLAAINMATINIERKLAQGGDGQKLRSNLDSIEKKIKESDQIINNLLFYTRLRAPEWQRVNIKGVLSDSIEMAFARHPDFNVDLQKHMDVVKGLEIDADPLQIKEVFTNVINNAFDALENMSGSVTVSAEVKDSQVLVSVIDTGKGIPRENLQKVFDAFFTTKSQGTGLGLAVTRQIIEAHHGDINISSKVGKGTTVTISLPTRRRE